MNDLRPEAFTVAEEIDMLREKHLVNMCKIPDRTAPNGSENTDFENALLPKELAEVNATRQMYERAWHARILICTTAISYINSTLASLVDKIEKEEVSPFKAYLGLAIAKFTAADSSPNRSHIPSHTHPTKANSHKLRKDKNMAKKVAVVTPRIMNNEVLNIGNE
ncbi:hypothetical protein EPUL_005118 [Erysiphe pulchra]|uniref:Uncharacterized protein n=1 Tax=Erysiphe pulchra TaxID=225359 RepID=A0A2S4PQ20_9PEZI|nr:hypothetical protein EPUL_005118 [Erysiphe pulchra]